MVAQPQPPRRGSGRGSHRLRAWLNSSKGSSGGNSGALVEPRAPAPPDEPPHPPLPLPRTPLFPDGGEDREDDEDDDLAPTLPRIPSIPRLPVAPTPPAARRLTVAGDFASFLLTRNYMRGPRLNGLTTEQRMRLFSLVGQVYLPVLIVTGRMPACDDLADLGDMADMVGCDCDDYGDDDELL